MRGINIKPSRSFEEGIDARRRLSKIAVQKISMFDNWTAARNITISLIKTTILCKIEASGLKSSSIKNRLQTKQVIIDRWELSCKCSYWRCFVISYILNFTRIHMLGNERRQCWAIMLTKPWRFRKYLASIQSSRLFGIDNGIMTDMPASYGPGSMAAAPFWKIIKIRTSTSKHSSEQWCVSALESLALHIQMTSSIPCRKIQCRIEKGRDNFLSFSVTRNKGAKKIPLCFEKAIDTVGPTIVHNSRGKSSHVVQATNSL